MLSLLFHPNIINSFFVDDYLRFRWAKLSTSGRHVMILAQSPCRLQVKTRKNHGVTCYSYGFRSMHILQFLGHEIKRPHKNSTILHKFYSGISNCIYISTRTDESKSRALNFGMFRAT